MSCFLSDVEHSTVHQKKSTVLQFLFFLGGYNQGYGAMPSAPAGQYDPRKVPGGQGYPPAGAYQQLPSYQHQQAVIVQPQQQIIVVGGCPACRVKQFY